MRRLCFIVAPVALVALLVTGAAYAQSGGDITGTSYLISDGSFQSGYGPENAFDDDTGTLVSMTSRQTYFGQDFGEAVDIALVRLNRSGGGGSYAFNGALYYSDDGTDWTLVVPWADYTGGWADTEVDAGSHQYWMFQSTTTGYSQVAEIEMIERDVVQATATPVATTESVQVYIEYPTPVPQYFDPTANDGDGPEPWLVRFYVGVFATFAFTYVLFRFVDTHQFYLLFMGLCMAAAWVTKSVNGAAYVYLFMLIMVLVLKLWGGLQRLVGFSR